MNEALITAVAEGISKATIEDRWFPCPLVPSEARPLAEAALEAVAASWGRPSVLDIT